MENMKAANTSKKKGTMYWGANTACLLQLGGKQRNWVGNCPLVYMLKEALRRGLENVWVWVSFTRHFNCKQTEKLELARYIIHNLFYKKLLYQEPTCRRLNY